MNNFGGTTQPLHYSDEVTLTPITVPKTISVTPSVTPYDTSTPSSIISFQTPVSRDGSFVSTSFELAPVDLSPVMTSQSGASMKDDMNCEPVEKVTENDSIRDLIMSAIGVMKSRKARPDTRR
jgi:hypothetical protein